jgi:hypothetical protein
MFANYSRSYSGSNRDTSGAIWIDSFSDGLVDDYYYPGTTDRIPMPDPGALYSTSSGSGTFPYYFELLYAEVKDLKTDVLHMAKQDLVNWPVDADYFSLVYHGGSWADGYVGGMSIVDLAMTYVKDGANALIHALGSSNHLPNGGNDLPPGTGGFYRDSAIHNKGMVLYQSAVGLYVGFFLNLDRGTRVATLTMGSVFARQYGLAL